MEEHALSVLCTQRAAVRGGERPDRWLLPRRACVRIGELIRECVARFLLFVAAAAEAWSWSPRGLMSIVMVDDVSIRARSGALREQALMCMHPAASIAIDVTFDVAVQIYFGAVRPASVSNIARRVWWRRAWVHTGEERRRMFLARKRERPGHAAA